MLKGKFQKKEHRKQMGVFFGKGKGNSIEWNVSTGLAQVYALRFKYMNTTGKPIPVLMKFIDSKGVVLKEDVLNLPETPDKWKMMSTTTGTFINAGHYKVLLRQKIWTELLLTHWIFNKSFYQLISIKRDTDKVNFPHPVSLYSDHFLRNRI